MPKVILKQSLSYANILETLRKVGISVGDELTEFLREHEGHQGLSIEDGRAYCRTCDQRSAVK